MHSRAMLSDFHFVLVVSTDTSLDVIRSASCEDRKSDAGREDKWCAGKVLRVKLLRRRGWCKIAACVRAGEGNESRLIDGG